MHSRVNRRADTGNRCISGTRYQMGGSRRKRYRAIWERISMGYRVYADRSATNRCRNCSRRHGNRVFENVVSKGRGSWYSRDLHDPVEIAIRSTGDGHRGIGNETVRSRCRCRHGGNTTHCRAGRVSARQRGNRHRTTQPECSCIQCGIT